LVSSGLFEKDKFDIISIGLMTLHMNSKGNVDKILDNCHKWLKNEGVLIVDIVENERLILFPQDYSQFYNDDKGNRHFFTYFKGFLHDLWFIKDKKEKEGYDFYEKVVLENGKDRVKTTKLYIPSPSELIGIIENKGFKLEEVLEIKGHTGNKLYCFRKSGIN